MTPLNLVTSSASIVVASVAAIVVVLISLFALFLAAGAALGQLSGVIGPWRPLAVALVLIEIVFAVLFCQGLLDVLRRDARFGVRWRRSARLARFAAANDLSYVLEVRDPPPVGLLFLAGTRRRVTDLMSTEEGPGFEIGNHQYKGSGVERPLRRFGFMVLGLPRRLPHMVLQSHANQRSLGRPNLPWRLTKNERLSLGGDFDRSFTLYCPARYEEDARYVFTPRLMGVLVERAAAFDIEIIDDRMLLSTPKPFRMDDPKTYELLGDLLGSVAALTTERSTLYRDVRALRPGRVGPYGRRLDIRVPVSTWVVAGLLAAFFVARLITLVLGLH